MKKYDLNILYLNYLKSYKSHFIFRNFRLYYTFIFYLCFFLFLFVVCCRCHHPYRKVFQG